MSVNTDHHKADGGETVGSDGADAAGPPREATEADWRSVPPVGEEGTVAVEWSDLREMRGRIDDLEREVDRLEAELAAANRQREATIDRYERLLEKHRGTTEETTTEGGGGVLARVGRWVRDRF